MPAQGGAQPKAGQQAPQPQPQPQAVAGGGHWSRQPIDFSALDKMDAVLDYKAGHLFSGTTRIDNLAAKINLAAGVLAIQNLSGQVYGGSFTIQNGRVVSRGTPSISGRVITSNLEISQLVRTGSVKGPVSVNADLAGTGASEAAIVASLQGKGKIAGRVTILGTAEQAAGTALLNVLGKQLSAVRGITGALSTAVNLFVGRPSDLAGDFTVTRGVVTTQNLTATNPQARALVHGNLQLPPWTMAMLADIYQLPQTAKPIMTVNLQGPSTSRMSESAVRPSSSRTKAASAEQSERQSAAAASARRRAATAATAAAGWAGHQDRPAGAAAAAAPEEDALEPLLRLVG